MKIPLEDYYEDIVGKAATGLRLGKRELAGKAGLSTEAVNDAMNGVFTEETARAVAPVLNLDADSLVECGKKAWHPEAVQMIGLSSFNTPFPIPGYAEMTVNAFLVWDPSSKQAAAFDTGADAVGILEKIKDHELTLTGIFLTHTHGDHIADVDRLRRETGNPMVYVNQRESYEGANLIDEGDRFQVGVLSMEARLTHGHSPGGTTFVISGLERKVAVVGDSLFANSMGGAPSSYLQALENNRKKILSLPGNTIICPGHGPMTTVGEEKAHNPFHPEFK